MITGELPAMLSADVPSERGDDVYSDLIVGFDGSASGRDALALARRIALSTGARPAVVCVRPYIPQTPGLSAEDENGGWAIGAERTLDEARAVLADVPGTTFDAIPDASPARALHRAAEDADAALIVLGSTHRNALRRVLPGTTAENVIHAAPSAVAIAPAGYADMETGGPFGLVVAAVDGGTETERVARIAAAVARRTVARLRVVTVIEHPHADAPLSGRGIGYGSVADALREWATQTLERAAHAAGPVTALERHVAEGAVGDEVARQSEDADLLVLGSRAYGPLRRVVLGSQTGRILRAAAVACPVLIVPRGVAEELDDTIVALGASGAGRAGASPTA